MTLLQQGDIALLLSNGDTNQGFPLTFSLTGGKGAFHQFWMKMGVLGFHEVSANTTVFFVTPDGFVAPWMMVKDLTLHYASSDTISLGREHFITRRRLAVLTSHMVSMDTVWV